MTRQSTLDWFLICFVIVPVADLLLMRLAVSTESQNLVEIFRI